jgi:hypothetical protein
MPAPRGSVLLSMSASNEAMPSSSAAQPAEENLRRARDGQHHTQGNFHEHYGVDLGERHWQSAQPVRLGWDGELHTQDEFTEWYGRDFWPDAPTGRAEQPAMGACAAAASPAPTSATEGQPSEKREGQLSASMFEIQAREGQPSDEEWQRMKTHERATDLTKPYLNFCVDREYYAANYIAHGKSKQVYTLLGGTKFSDCILKLRAEHDQEPYVFCHIAPARTCPLVLAFCSDCTEYSSAGKPVKVWFAWISQKSDAIA